jgi:mono/diheme cytochrome c family protein
MRRFLLIAVALTSCMAQQPAVSIQPDSAAVLAGRKVFRANCSGCHGGNAAGTLYAPSLHSAEVQSRDAESLFRFITNGKLREGMPSFSRLPDARRWQVVAYVKSLSNSSSASH